MPEAPPYVVRARAPLRVDLAGGGTDVPGFTSGAAVVAALTLSVHVEILLGGGTIRLRAEDRGRQVTLGSPSAITYDGRLDAPKAALNMLPVTGGLEILSRSDAPPGAGLGERGALNVALLAALSDCRNEATEPATLAELAFQLEAEELKRVAGRADPYVAALGAVQQLTFGSDTVRARRLSLDGERLAELGAHLLVVSRGGPYAAEGAARRTQEALASGDPAVVGALSALGELARPMADALEAGDWQRVGAGFEEAARQRESLDPTWVAPPTRALVDAARQAGAWGVKPSGPRAGASLVVLGPRQRRSAIADALRGRGGVVLDCGLAAEGVSVWREDRPEA